MQEIIRDKHDDALASAIERLAKKGKALYTGSVCREYLKVCRRRKLEPLSDGTISNRLTRFDELGIIQATLMSKGRYGRTKIIIVDLNENEKICSQKRQIHQ